jgi:hypothetical protein
MNKTQAAGVQSLAPQTIDHPAQLGVRQVVDPASVCVQRIAEKRETGFGQVNSDLVGTSGFKS